MAIFSIAPFAAPFSPVTELCIPNAFNKVGVKSLHTKKIYALFGFGELFVTSPPPPPKAKCKEKHQKRVHYCFIYTTLYSCTSSLAILLIWSPRPPSRCTFVDPPPSFRSSSGCLLLSPSSPHWPRLFWIRIMSSLMEVGRVVMRGEMRWGRGGCDTRRTDGKSERPRLPPFPSRHPDLLCALPASWTDKTAPFGFGDETPPSSWKRPIGPTPLRSKSETCRFNLGTPLPPTRVAWAGYVGDGVGV